MTFGDLCRCAVYSSGTKGLVRAEIVLWIEEWCRVNSIDKQPKDRTIMNTLSKLATSGVLWKHKKTYHYYTTPPFIVGETKRDYTAILTMPDVFYTRIVEGALGRLPKAHAMTCGDLCRCAVYSSGTKGLVRAEIVLWIKEWCRVNSIDKPIKDNTIVKTLSTLTTSGTLWKHKTTHHYRTCHPPATKAPNNIKHWQKTCC